MLPSSFRTAAVLACLGAASWGVAGSARAEPGGEQVVAEKTLTATVYVVDARRTPKGEWEVSFAWLPPAVAKECAGKALRWCEDLDQCQRFPALQACNADFSRCQPKVREECKRFGLGAESAPMRDPADAPSQVLRSSPFTLKAAEGAKWATRWHLPPKGTEAISFPDLKKDRTVRAKLRWEQWTNGENFRVLQLLP